MSKISRRKMLASGGKITIAAGAMAIVGKAFAAQPGMTSHEFSEAEIKAMAAPLHARLRDSMEAAGLKGRVVAGYNVEQDDFFARWEDWTMGRRLETFAARIEWRAHEERREEFIAWFVQQCLGDERISRNLNGNLSYIQWHPVT